MLTDADLLKIRDEIGITEPPTDDDLADAYDERGNWQAVALSVLKRRRAVLVGGSQSLAIPGVISIGQTQNASISGLDAQIARLEAELRGGGAYSRLYRRDIIR